MESQRIKNRYIKLADLKQLLQNLFPDSNFTVDVYMRNRVAVQYTDII